MIAPGQRRVLYQLAARELSQNEPRPFIKNAVDVVLDRLDEQGLLGNQASTRDAIAKLRRTDNISISNQAYNQALRDLEELIDE